MAATEQQPSEDKTSEEIATRWQQEIARYEKWAGDWHRRARKILKLYARQNQDTGVKRKFAMLWANTEVLKPSVLAQAPVPQVSRRYKDKDKTGRIAAELLERACAYSQEKSAFADVLFQVRDDLLLPGRGTAWIRVETDEDSTQSLIHDYVQWKDFMHSPARYWKEVTWVGKWSYLTKDQIEQRWDKKLARELQYDHKALSESQYAAENDTTRGVVAKAAIAEIWDKTTRKVYFISRAHPVPLEVSEPFLTLQDYWPTPKPAFATLTNESLIPTPDYTYYRDQAEEIDDLTARIASLTDSLKVVGFYPGGADNDVQQALEKALKPGTENQMIPVNSWAAFAEKGGQSIIVFLPIKEVAETVKACIELRAQLIQDVYQISGISDVLRGATDPDETATAQSLKAQWGSVRIRDRQKMMANFARDCTRIGCEIMAENFDFGTLRQMANMMPQPQQEAQPQQPIPAPSTADPSQDMGMAQPSPAGPEGMDNAGAMPAPSPESPTEWDESLMPEVEALLKNDKLRSFRIDIETDSTIQPDEDADKQRRVEFIEAVSSFVSQAMPIAQAQPALLPVMGEMLQFLVRGFRAGRNMEDAIERSMEQLGQQAQQPPPPDPRAEAEQAKLQMLQEKHGMDMEAKQADIGMKREANQVNLEGIKAKAGAEREKAVMDLQLKHAEMGLKQQEFAQERAMGQQKAADERMMARENMAMKVQMERQKFATQQQQANAAHQQGMRKAALDEQMRRQRMMQPPRGPQR